MQLEISPEIEQELDRESRELGITSAELSARVLEGYVNQRQARTYEPASTRKSRTIADYVDWMKSRSPDYETQDPYAVDWQAIKSEGRRY